ncbi:MAG: NAD-dependent deacylase [Propionicimonas sp.]
MATSRMVILTGAGISQESGLPTFRDANGLWEGYRPEEVASPLAFARMPEVVQEFYDLRRRAALAVEPNAAHVALARLEQELDRQGNSGAMVIVTQNIDDLHERAGSKRVIHMHGELNSALCTACGSRARWTRPLADRPACPSCGSRSLRPDIVWFGENVYRMDEIEQAVENCETFAVIGTSGMVYPAAGLAAYAKACGARTVLLNLEDQPLGLDYDEREIGPATKVVPEWVERYLADLA